MMLGFVPRPNLQICDRANSVQFGDSGPAAIVADRTIGHNSFTENISFAGDKFDSIQETGRLERTTTTITEKIALTQISSSKISSKTASNHEFSSSQVGSNKRSPVNKSIPKIGITQVGFTEIGSNQLTTVEVGTYQVCSTQSSTSQVCSYELGSAQVSPIKISSNQFNSNHFSVGQINFPEIRQNQINTFNGDSSEVSFASSISSQQFFSSHNSTSQIINRLNNSVTNIWSNLLQSETKLDIHFQITDLPTGQLAEATITGFESSGKPNTGTILIDHDANGVGWFIDETPLDNSEFINQNSDSYFLADPESAANGKYDLLTTVLHELAHLYGFIEGYAGFDNNLQTQNNTTKFVGDNFTATLDGEHLDKQAHPYDLLNTHLAPGIRKLPSQLDVEILKTILAFESEKIEKISETLDALLTSDPLLGIINGDFSINDQTSDNLGWQNRGASNIIDGQAVLTEDSPFLSNFSQTFTVPEDANTLEFTLVDLDLSSPPLLPGEGLGERSINPPDSFEVALLDPLTLNPLISTDIGISETDALLNIQNDGTTYFSNNVRISGVNTGEIIDYAQSRTFTIDISHLAAGTEATLYFDLLGFGEVDSRVVIDDVQFTEQIFLAPIAVDDSATTNQGESVTIEILSNDLTEIRSAGRDDDGTIRPDSVQIATQPNNGFAIANSDGYISYVPGTNFAGTDSFTYVVKDNDGQFSNPATVTVTVDNVAPQIDEIQIPDNIIEGTETTIIAIASDLGNYLNLQLEFWRQYRYCRPNTIQAQGDRKNHWQTYTYKVLASKLDLTALEFRAVGKEDKKGGFIDVVSVQEIIL